MLLIYYKKKRLNKIIMKCPYCNANVLKADKLLMSKYLPHYEWLCLRCGQKGKWITNLKGRKNEKRSM